MRYTPFYNHFNMEKHCTMVYFSLRESKQNKKGLSPIEVSISTNGKRIYFSTGKYARSTDWNREKQLVKGKSEEAQLVNSYLTQLRNKIYQKEIELLQMSYLITAELLKEAVADKVEALNEKSLFEVFEEHNREQEKLVGNGVSKATYWISVYTVLFREYPDIKKAYYLSMRLGLIYHQCRHKDVALTRLARWYDEVDKSGFLAFGRVARSIQTHYLEIINFFEKRSTNAASESFNAKIKNFRAQFRGVKDKAFFLYRLTKIYA